MRSRSTISFHRHEQHHDVGAAILVANHASYIDSVVLMATIPTGFRFLAERGWREMVGLRGDARTISAQECGEPPRAA